MSVAAYQIDFPCLRFVISNWKLKFKIPLKWASQIRFLKIRVLFEIVRDALVWCKQTATFDSRFRIQFGCVVSVNRLVKHQYDTVRPWREWAHSVHLCREPNDNLKSNRYFGFSFAIDCESQNCDWNLRSSEWSSFEIETVPFKSSS